MFVGLVCVCGVCRQENNKKPHHDTNPINHTHTKNNKQQTTTTNKQTDARYESINHPVVLAVAGLISAAVSTYKHWSAT